VLRPSQTFWVSSATDYKQALYRLQSKRAKMLRQKHLKSTLKVHGKLKEKKKSNIQTPKINLNNCKYFIFFGNTNIARIIGKISNTQIIKIYIFLN
jgi:hypothetical protein